MVERGVERGALLVRGVRHLEAIEQFAPLCARRVADFLERPPLRLGGVVLRRAVLVHGGDRRLRDERRARRKLQHPPLAPLLRVGLRQEARVRPRTVEHDLPADAALEPGMRAASADDRGARRIEPVRELHDGTRHVAGVDPLEVDEHLHGLAGGVRVAVHAHARRRRELHGHARVGEGDRVEAGASLLRTKVLREAPRARIGRGEVVRERQQTHVGEVRTPRAAQVGLREAVDAGILPHVAGAMVPVAESRVGTHLNQRERARRARKRVPAIRAADQRVHGVERIDGRGGGRKGRRDESHGNVQLHAFCFLSSVTNVSKRAVRGKRSKSFTRAMS